MTETFMNEGIEVQSVRNCILCNSAGDTLYSDLHDCLFGAPGSWNFLKCSSCGMAWLDPQPVPEAVWMLYRGYYTHNASSSENNWRGWWPTLKRWAISARYGYPLEREWLMGKLAGKVVASIGPLREIIDLSVMTLDSRRQGRLLDVGCGAGGFLVRMRQFGWEVYGVEPDVEAARVARELHHLTVLVGRLEDVNLPDGAFDAVTLHHVLEHVLDPLGLLRGCARIICQNGRIVIVTPNFGSLSHRIFGHAWRGLDIPRHINLFTPATLASACSRIGLRVEKVATLAQASRRVWDASRLISSGYRHSTGSCPFVTREMVSHGRSVESHIYWALQYFLARFIGIGEEVLVIASK